MIPVFIVYDELNEILYNNILNINYEEKTVTVYHERETLHIPFAYAKFLQSTELKDESGMEIFEGDVVNVQTKEQEPKIVAERHIKGVMTYSYGRYEVEVEPNVFDDIMSELFLRDMDASFEVLGNIYDGKTKRY